MTKEEARELIPLFALGALDEKDHAQVLRYLFAHPEMQQEYETYRTGVDKLGALGPTPPDGLLESIMERIEAPSAPLAFPRRKRGLAERLLPAIAAMLVLSVGLNAYFAFRTPAHLSAPIALSGTDAARQASGTLIAADGQGVLLVSGLAPLDDGHDYQLWLIKDGKRTSGGVFSVPASGTGHLVINIPVTGYDAYGITVEPAGGSPAPTGMKVMGS